MFSSKQTPHQSEEQCPVMISTTQANKKAQKVPTAVLKIAAALFWIFIWFIASRAVGSELLLPSPTVTLARLRELALKGSFWLAVLQSLLRIIAGCALGIAAGSILGVLTAMSRVLYELFTPLLTVVRSTPVASFIILALVWIKRDNVAVFIAFLMVLPILWGNVSRGIAECDRDLIEMAHIFRFSKKDMLKKIYLPSVRPYFFAGCSTALGLSWKAGVAAEVLSLPKHALGSELYYSKIYLETPTLFAVTLVVILLSVALEFVLRLILKKTAGWEK
ncbi:MAG: ABC transporter permease subunit [Ruminococcaceae bacterium]|nr:ABC transporter permease subunit [Oscillospiraceae bacterium]